LAGAFHASSIISQFYDQPFKRLCFNNLHLSKASHMPHASPERSAPVAEHSSSGIGERDGSLPVSGFKGTPDEIDRQWYEEVYRGRGDSMAQLTWRAILIGSCLGSVLSLTNLYIGLKAGWGFGVAITASILSYAIWTSLLKVGIARTPMSILENNCMQSTASSAGYSTGGTLVSAFAAFIIVNGHSMSVPLMLAWVFFIAVLGVTMAIPMKRQMINIEQLRFPSGIAAAETLRALHAQSSQGLRAAKALGLAGLVAAIDKVWAEGMSVISANLERFSSGALLTELQKWLFGSHYEAWSGRTVVFSWDLIFIAAGAITGMRVCATMFVSGTLCWAVAAPILQTNGVITGQGFSAIVQWTLWFGASCMVAGGLLSFALSWRMAIGAFRDLRDMLLFPRAAASSALNPTLTLEAPMTWFAAGQIVSLVALAWLGYASFGMPLWQGALAVALSYFLALVACRVTGETDTTPIGAMGKVTQLTFGALSPGNVNVNLMSANITAGAATSAADLLTDLKSGYLLGANPRQQFLAQFPGIFVGTVVTVLTFAILVPNAQVLGTDQFPAPAAQTWSAVAVALGRGLSSLEPVKLWLIAAGGIVGVLLTVAPALFPRYQDYLPSAAGFGLAWVFHWYYGLLFFLGALAAMLVERRKPKLAEEFTFPVASGVVAGGSLMGVVLILWANGASVFAKLLGG
jgi:OPT family oligopeptide transporter